MTRKERKIIEDTSAWSEAIKTLSEQPCENCISSIWEDVDKEEISKAVVLLDLFTKTFCRYKNDYGRFDDLKFRCDECPFQKEDGKCLVKSFKNKYAPDYRDFGCMGDL